MLRPIRALVALGLVLTLTPANPAHADGRSVTIFAAASLKNALDAVIASARRATGISAVVSYGASSTLAKQIEAGAPAQIFISADQDWMDHLERSNALMAGTRRNLLGNSLVLIAPKEQTAAVRIVPGFPLAAMLGGGRLAVAETTSVPAGKYTKAALLHLGVWAFVEHRLAQAANVRAALALVARGEAPLGIVYATDAAAEPAVRVVATFPAVSHPAIVYPVALTATADAGVASDLFAYLTSEEAGTIFARYGFTTEACGGACRRTN